MYCLSRRVGLLPDTLLVGERGERLRVRASVARGDHRALARGVERSTVPVGDHPACALDDGDQRREIVELEPHSITRSSPPLATRPYW